jgi:hypothetical protein
LFNDKNNGFKNGQIVPKTENDLSEIADHDENNDYDSEDQGNLLKGIDNKIVRRLHSFPLLICT